ncbi:MAG: formate dehydrogenase accessory protein FdhE [bacterium]
MLINKYPPLREIVLFGYELFVEQKNIQPELDLIFPKLIPELINIKMKEGFPLLKKSEITVPFIQFKEVFKRISLTVAEKRKPLKSKILELLKRFENKEIDIWKLALSTLKGDEDTIKESNQKEKNGEIIGFLIRNSLKPFGNTCGIALNSYLPSEKSIWSQSYCPICGSYPLLAYIEGEEGRRSLICSWCDTSWAYPRLKCPYCHNTDQKDLNYFSLDEEEIKEEKDRVCVCEKCGKYIKTLEARKREGKKPIDFQLDDLATIHLDLLAEREGYERMIRSFFFL